MKRLILLLSVLGLATSQGFDLAVEICPVPAVQQIVLFRQTPFFVSTEIFEETALILGGTTIPVTVVPTVIETRFEVTTIVTSTATITPEGDPNSNGPNTKVANVETSSISTSSGKLSSGSGSTTVNDPATTGDNFTPEGDPDESTGNPTGSPTTADNSASTNGNLTPQGDPDASTTASTTTNDPASTSDNFTPEGDPDASTGSSETGNNPTSTSQGDPATSSSSSTAGDPSTSTNGNLTPEGDPDASTTTSPSSSAASSTAASSTGPSSTSAETTSTEPSSTSSSTQSPTSSTSECIITATPVPACCLNELPGECKDLGTTNGVALKPVIQACKKAFGNYLTPDIERCMQGKVTADSKGPNIAQCLTWEVEDLCIVALPKACSDLRGVTGAAVVDGADKCRTALGPFVHGIATPCLDPDYITDETLGNSIVDCLQVAYGFRSGLVTITDGSLCPTYTATWS